MNHNRVKVPSGIFLLRSGFPKFNLHCMCHVVELYSVANQSALECDVLCEGWGRSFSVRACESGHFDLFSSLYDSVDLWPWRSMGCGCELNTLIPSETTGTLLLEMFGKKQGKFKH